VKKYDEATAAAILRLNETNSEFAEWIECKPDGLHLKKEQLQYAKEFNWTYAHDLDGDDAPNPLTAPSLPFPFTGNQLAAFMLDGIGAATASMYGNLEDGRPNQTVLDSPVEWREPKRALQEAYAAFAKAQDKVGNYPRELQQVPPCNGHSSRRLRQTQGTPSRLKPSNE